VGRFQDRLSAAATHSSSSSDSQGWEIGLQKYAQSSLNGTDRYLGWTLVASATVVPSCWSWVQLPHIPVSEAKDAGSGRQSGLTVQALKPLRLTRNHQHNRNTFRQWLIIPSYCFFARENQPLFSAVTFLKVCSESRRDSRSCSSSSGVCQSAPTAKRVSPYKSLLFI
jgi:hypothetical protein